MKVQILLSLEAISLSEEQQALVHSETGEWETLEVSNGRFLIHAIVTIEAIALIEMYLLSLSYTPVIIGVFRVDGLSLGQELVDIGTDEVPNWQVQGTALYPINQIELLNFTPGIATSHQFGGWEIPLLN